ncbi:MAG TPA: amidase [Pseudonocardiaceae bacterium]|nr:amidase [Pseudonocardiaceae bacterium]
MGSGKHPAGYHDSPSCDGDPWGAIVQVVGRQQGGAGALSGWPVAVKDLIDVAGVPTRCGSAVLADAAPAQHDADVVARLRAAGAVVVAKTHTHEFAYGPTGDVAAEGPCRNPHDPQRITGGSSSGSAAAVAAGLVPLAVGTDTGCSTRTPAALCGVVGLKPASGALPTTGVFPLSETLDHIGLLGIDVDTVAVAFSALTGRRIDPTAPMAGIVVGRPTDVYWRVHDPEIAAAVDRAADALHAAGAILRDTRLPGIEEMAATYPVIVGVEAYTTHRHWLAQRCADYQPATAARLHTAAGYTAADYVAAQRTRQRLATEVTDRLTTEGIDLLLLPTTPLRATPIGARQVDAPDGTRVAVAPALLSLTLPFNLLGWPAVSVPAPGMAGLPIGIQIAAVRGGEQAVLAAGSRIASFIHDGPTRGNPAPDRRRRP